MVKRREWTAIYYNTQKYALVVVVGVIRLAAWDVRSEIVGLGARGELGSCVEGATLEARLRSSAEEGRKAGLRSSELWSGEHGLCSGEHGTIKVWRGAGSRRVGGLSIETCRCVRVTMGLEACCGVRVTMGLEACCGVRVTMGLESAARFSISRFGRRISRFSRRSKAGGSVSVLSIGLTRHGHMLGTHT